MSKNLFANNSNGIFIESKNVIKKFENTQVLKELNLTINSGEFVCVVGRSGCGKSTFLRLLAGLEKVSQGEITLDGVKINGVHPDIRIMFQDSRLLPWRTVIENVALGLPKESYDLAIDALKEVGLENKANEWPANLSGGQKQRVALARALVHKPRLLLLDEPLGALDALTRIEMQTLIERIWQEHKFTVLLVTHDVSEAVILGDRVVLIEEGKITLDLEINLSRQRERGSAEFAQLEANILSRVMGTMYYI
ncbi:ATP-binding cassette domain-containing protein [Aliarcobacter cibarius]|jgi:sulfonate transport system ATP-binding protein|uniref:ATP-binding cassette domain-containing protein n=1 Tax=Aliarcobacter cibarius TaxID=255507 RepID=A0A5J6RMZ7_9BACT|nr:ATP-binding cassette domain-containing protein [Aliarcobacter cibarius]QEZ90228.1 nitrate/sulfonate/bicarbonate ABC transporter, ATP-binding protein [Aliarcobacter cibarius]QKJ26224.1 nitrate/sulfonate/bicarbonate ABC transporter, ATP-binding protein [Aliarcobacter cibarius]TLS97819.1 ATP-binding cassette domain-containing protein [Aliarcobacter cibarius]TLS98634.1 ATP-binding cassette domain-containing protein [Aliarcobacter cibarius]TLT02701.1 ATP-binding cassette domain-containing protei